MPSMNIDSISPYNMPYSKDFLGRAYAQNGDLDEAFLKSPTPAPAWPVSKTGETGLKRFLSHPSRSILSYCIDWICISGFYGQRTGGDECQ